MPKTALIAVDVQNDYLPNGPLGFPDSDSIIPALVEYAALAADIVICSRNIRPAGSSAYCIKGTPGAKIVPELASISANPKNYVITKSLDHEGYSAFEGGTLRPLESLEDILAREEVTHVSVGGYWLNGCVAQTAFDANALGYNTAIEERCTLPSPVSQTRTEHISQQLLQAGIPLV